MTVRTDLELAAGPATSVVPAAGVSRPPPVSPQHHSWTATSWRTCVAIWRSASAGRRCPRGAARPDGSAPRARGRRRSALHLQLTASTSAGGSDVLLGVGMPVIRLAAPRVVASTALGKALAGDSVVVIAIEPGDVAVLTSARRHLETSRGRAWMPAALDRPNGRGGQSLERSSRYSCTMRIATAPSPTDEATRFTDPDRTSPTAKTPGMLVSNCRPDPPVRT